jgi:GMP synthase-like glutamine amidotransferase
VLPGSPKSAPDGGRVRALVIQYEATAPGGLLSQWLEQRGAEEDVYRMAVDGGGGGRDPNPRAYDLIVSLGSEAAAYDDAVPWVERQAALLREAAQAEVPVLGICFGGQLLARALGGEALPAARPEIGWTSIHTEDPELIAEGPWLQWHYDTFTVPPGATLLARSALAPQAFTIGRSLGVQFHPEVTPDIVAGWVAEGRDKLDRDGVDPGRLLADTHEHIAENRTRAWRLFDAFMDRVARVGSAA